LDLQDFCRSRIAHERVPQYVQFLDSFPMTVTGKIQNLLLRQRARETFGLTDEAHA
jgi:fatty-acyl-CoA synthase